MSEDARTEARRRLVTALHAAHCGCPDYPFEADPDGADPLFGQLADAVLGLFPDVSLEPLLVGEGWTLPALGDGSPRNASRLVLRSAVEPVTKESPDA